MQTSICNKCGAKISINIQKSVIDQDTDGENIVEQFFLCPKCGERYTILIFDSFMKEKIAARKRLRRSPLQCNRVLDKELEKQMQQHFKGLKAKYYE